MDHVASTPNYVHMVLAAMYPAKGFSKGRNWHFQDGRGPGQSDAIQEAKTQQGSSGGIPVAVAIPSPKDAQSISEAGADGVCLNIASMSSSSAADQVGSKP